MFARRVLVAGVVLVATAGGAAGGAERGSSSQPSQVRQSDGGKSSREARGRASWSGENSPPDAFRYPGGSPSAEAATSKGDSQASGGGERDGWRGGELDPGDLKYQERIDQAIREPPRAATGSPQEPGEEGPNEQGDTVATPGGERDDGGGTERDAGGDSRERGDGEDAAEWGSPSVGEADGGAKRDDPDSGRAAAASAERGGAPPREPIATPTPDRDQESAQRRPAVAAVPSVESSPALRACGEVAAAARANDLARLERIIAGTSLLSSKKVRDAFVSAWSHARCIEAEEREGTASVSVLVGEDASAVMQKVPFIDTGSGFRLDAAAYGAQFLTTDAREKQAPPGPPAGE